MSDQLALILITLTGVLAIGVSYAMSLWLPEDHRLHRFFRDRRLTVTCSKDAWWLKTGPAD